MTGITAAYLPAKTAVAPLCRLHQDIAFHRFSGAPMPAVRNEY